MSIVDCMLVAAAIAFVEFYAVMHRGVLGVRDEAVPQCLV